MSETGKTYTMDPTDELCWRHRHDPLWWVEFSDGQKDLYCFACDGPSHPLGH